MKNVLDINTRYNRLESLNFIQRFATAYMYLETLTNTAGNVCNPDIFGYCAGCNGDCKKDEATGIRCKFFFLFNTMSGNSAIRCHFDSKPTETQKLVGDTDEEKHGCGSDFMIDFLFGYAGYDYRKCTDAAMFKDEIIAAINAGKPVIAKVKSDSSRFYFVNGYDGDALMCPDFTNKHWNFVKNGWETIGPDGPPIYDAIDTLYIFGDKTARRHTLKDGLQNIRRAMESNIREKVWDGYLAKLDGNEFIKLPPEQRKARALRLYETVPYVFNIVSFMGAFASDKNPHSHYLHQELWVHPAFAELANRINEQHWIILNNGHKFGGFANRDWLHVDPSEIPGICTGMCEVIEEIKKSDMRLLELINQAIEIFDNK